MIVVISKRRRGISLGFKYPEPCRVLQRGWRHFINAIQYRIPISTTPAMAENLSSRISNTPWLFRLSIVRHTCPWEAEIFPRRQIRPFLWYTLRFRACKPAIVWSVRLWSGHSQHFRTTRWNRCQATRCLHSHGRTGGGLSGVYKDAIKPSLSETLGHSGQYLAAFDSGQARHGLSPLLGLRFHPPSRIESACVGGACPDSRIPAALKWIKPGKILAYIHPVRKIRECGRDMLRNNATMRLLSIEMSKGARVRDFMPECL